MHTSERIIQLIAELKYKALTTQNQQLIKEQSSKPWTNIDTFDDNDHVLIMLYQSPENEAVDWSQTCHKNKKKTKTKEKR